MIFSVTDTTCKGPKLDMLRGLKVSHVLNYQHDTIRQHTLRFMKEKENVYIMTFRIGDWDT